MITAEQLKELHISEDWLEPLNDALQRYEINTPLRMAAFIGQCAHESGNFKTLQENLNYSAESLCRVWPSRFPTLESAQPYHRNPDKIANKVYGGRMGNGTEETEEGSLYKGRGLIQLRCSPPATSSPLRSRSATSSTTSSPSHRRLI